MLKKMIESYVPYNEQEEADKLYMLEFIDKFDNYLIRDNKFGHFTASSWVVNEDKTKVLMIYHNIYNSWAWTGGHADGVENLSEVALREIKEETSASDLKLLINDIYSLEVIPVSSHIKKGKYVSAHVHLNISFLVEAKETEILKIKEDENSGVKWVDINECIDLSSEEQMKVIYKKLNKKMFDINKKL